MSLIRKDSPLDRLPAGLSTALAALHRPISFVYESNTVGAAAQASAAITADDLAAMTDGYYVEVNGVRFYCRDEPGPGDLPSVALAPTAADVLGALALLLRRAPALRGDYDVLLTPTGELTLRAQRPGTAYNLALAQAGTAFGLVGTPGADGVFAQTKADYAVYCDVWRDADPNNTTRLFDPAGVPYAQASWREAGRLRKDYTGENLFTFDVAEVLAHWARPIPPRYADITIPAGGYPVFEYADGMLCRYAVEVGEEWTEAGAPVRRPKDRLGWGYPADTPPAMLWGVAAAQSAALAWGDAAAQFLFYWRRKPGAGGGSPRVVRPLTGQPSVKLSHVQAIEYLYLLYEPSADNMTHLDVRFDFVYEDCAPEEEVYFARFAATRPLRYGGAFYVEVSPRTFDWQALETAAGSRLAEYTVTIVEHDGNTANAVPVTTPQTYLLDDAARCRELPTVLMWLNPLGGYDTWTPQGAVIKEIDADGQTHEAPITHATLPGRQLPGGHPDYTRLADKRTYRIAARASYETHLGWVDGETMEWLRGVLAATEVYVIRFADEDTRLGGAIQPRRVTITGQDWARNEREDLHALTLELELCYEQPTINQ